MTTEVPGMANPEKDLAEIVPMGLTVAERAALATLDPANRTLSTSNTRYAETLEDVLKTDPSRTTEPEHRLSRPTRRRNRIRVASLVGAAAAVAAIAIVLPGAIGTKDAYAAWSPVGTAVDGQDGELLALKCQGILPDAWRPMANPNEPGMKVAQALREGPTSFAAETRGEYTLTTVYSGSLGITCFSDQDDQSTFILHEDAALPDADAIIASRTRLLRSPSEATGPQVRTSDGIVAEIQEVSAADKTAPTVFAARLGANVTGVTLSGPELPQTRVTVIGNAGMAWWPGDLTKATTATITFTDGTTRQVPIDDIVPWDGDSYELSYEKVPANPQ